MNENFNELPWHDSVLESIFIDRSNPGENDSIRIEVEWSDGKHSSIIFHDCYAITADMNFGVIASETILTAECFTETEDTISMRKK